MQRFSAQIPWVLVQSGDNRVDVTCEVCGDTVNFMGGEGDRVLLTGMFADQHAAHRAPTGSFGLGDLVAKVAKPIAALFGKSEPCSPCEARRRALNQLRRR